MAEQDRGDHDHEADQRRPPEVEDELPQVPKVPFDLARQFVSRSSFQVVRSMARPYSPSQISRFVTENLHSPRRGGRRGAPTSRGAGSALEGPGDLAADPAAVEVARLGDDDLAVERALVHQGGIEGDGAADRLEARRGVGVEPGGARHDGAVGAGRVEVARRALELAEGPAAAGGRRRRRRRCPRAGRSRRAGGWSRGRGGRGSIRRSRRRRGRRGRAWRSARPAAAAGSPRPTRGLRSRPWDGC